jgi:peptidoglycan hydrolase-like protein with peptidoglycan-binding domain
MNEGDEPLPLGNPPVLEHATPTGATEVAQRLVAFPFTPPDVKLKEKEALSSSNDWFTKHDKNKIDQLGSLDFYASSGPQSVGVVPKLHNTSAGIEIYQLPPTLTKETFEKTEGPYRSGVTKKYSNKRSGEKIAKFKAGTMAQSGLACFHMSRLLGHLVEVPPATYRTMDLQEFQKVGDQARTTGHPSCTEAWAELRAIAKSGSSKLILPDGKTVYGSLAQNPRGEDSSPEDYWTVGAIRGHSFYKVLSSKESVANILHLNDPKCLQDLALAQDMIRGVILDSIFRQVDRLGNISVDQLQHYVNRDGRVKWDDELSEKDKADAVSPIFTLKRIIYKDNDDGMMWGMNSISVTPILTETHHLDETIYNRLQWLAGLMQDSEPGSDAKIKDYFVNVVHVSGDNYDKLKASLLKQAASLKSRVDSKDIQLDLDFEGTMKKLYVKEVEAAQAGATEPVETSLPPGTATPTPQEPDLSAPRAQEITEHTAPNGTVELATRPSTFPGRPEIYSQKDIEKEKELAAIDFYNGKTKDDLDIVLIPKTYSTSPGLNVHAIKLPAGASRLSYASAHTGKGDSGQGKMIAKYKQSIPTHFTYSPSIIGYYHLSRFLDAGHVEPAIVRTMDVASHKPLADLGKAKATGSNNRTQWTELRALDDSHSNPSLYTKDGKQLYGVLQANPTGEQSYPHLSDLGGAAAFAASSEFARVTSSSPLKLNYKDAAGKLNQAAVQQIVQIRDLSDMVLMDYIMSQADRFSGNMHSEKVYLWIENGVLKSDSKKSDPAKAAEQLKQIPADAVLVNRMIMKDNDAGLISGNSAKTYHLLEKISHMDSKTYDRLLDLQKELQKPEVAQWYQTELLFTSADFNTVKNNVDQAVAILSGRKGNGLFLDANVSAAIGAVGNQAQETETTPGSGNVVSTPPAVITGSVGRWEKGAGNLPADVETVQRLLQTAAQKLQAPQLDPKGVDGKIARPPGKSNTVAAIEAFQSRSNISIDGLIEPGSQAWQALLQAADGLLLDANVSAAIGAADNQAQETETTPGSGNVASTPSAVITGSVGRWEKGAGNLQADVETVQRLLQTAAQKLQAPQLDPKGVDGKIGRPPRTSNTVNAIEAFQSRSNISIDGLIEPGSQTWRALLQAAGGS